MWCVVANPKKDRVITSRIYHMLEKIHKIVVTGGGIIAILTALVSAVAWTTGFLEDAIKDRIVTAIRNDEDVKEAVTEIVGGKAQIEKLVKYLGEVDSGYTYTFILSHTDLRHKFLFFAKAGKQEVSAYLLTKDGRSLETRKDVELMIDGKSYKEGSELSRGIDITSYLPESSSYTDKNEIHVLAIKGLKTEDSILRELDDPSRQLPVTLIVLVRNYLK